MKKKETPYLDLYIECMETGKLRHEGLCSSLASMPLYPLFEELFEPFWQECFENKHWAGYWGAKLTVWGDEKRYGFNEFRQNVVLFMAAINDEL